MHPGRRHRDGHLGHGRYDGPWHVADRQAGSSAWSSFSNHELEMKLSTSSRRCPSVCHCSRRRSKSHPAKMVSPRGTTPSVIAESKMRVPTNVKFEIDDLTQEWTYPSNMFDFIHVRTLGGSIKDWVSFLREAFESVTVCSCGGLVLTMAQPSQTRWQD